jgi:hypothetical protein
LLLLFTIVLRGFYASLYDCFARLLCFVKNNNGRSLLGRPF